MFRRLIFIFGFLLFSSLLIPTEGTQGDVTNYEISISLNPTSSLFKSTDSMSFNTNMAPGDSETREITVLNSGNVSFNYSLAARKENGDESLFEKLLITIKDTSSDQLLYEEGLIKDINLSLGNLTKNSSKIFEVTVKLPISAGNSLQNKSTSIALDFIAQSTPIVPPPSGCVGSDCDTPPTCEERGDCPEEQTCEDRGDCPEEQTCEERGDCPEEQTCEERGDCPEEKTCQELGTCPEQSCEEVDDCITDEEIVLEDEKVPTDVPEEDTTELEDEMVDEESTPLGGELPKTAVPWYNLLIASISLLLISGAFMWKLRRRGV